MMKNKKAITDQVSKDHHGENKGGNFFKSIFLDLSI